MPLRDSDPDAACARCAPEPHFRPAQGGVGPAVQLGYGGPAGLERGAARPGGGRADAGVHSDGRWVTGCPLTASRWGGELAIPPERAQRTAGPEAPGSRAGVMRAAGAAVNGHRLHTPSHARRLVNCPALLVVAGKGRTLTMVIDQGCWLLAAAGQPAAALHGAPGGWVPRSATC